MKAYSGSQRKTKRTTKNRVLSNSLLWNKIYFIDFLTSLSWQRHFSETACPGEAALAPGRTGTGISRYEKTDHCAGEGKPFRDAY